MLIKGEGECGSLTNGRHLFAEYAQQWGRMGRHKRLSQRLSAILLTTLDINSLNRTMLIGQRKGGIDEQNDSSGYMITANFLILNGQAKLLPDFQEVLEHDYFTNIIDNANTPKGKERANKLCKTITKGDITNLPINLTGPRAAQLFNAVTLKTAWSLPFYKELTKSMPFHCEDGRTRQVRMMMNDDTMQMYQGY